MAENKKQISEYFSGLPENSSPSSATYLVVEENGVIKKIPISIIVRQDSNGKATVAELKVTGSGIDCEGLLEARDGASFGSSVSVQYGETLRLYNENNSKSADMYCDDDGKLLLNGKKVATLNDIPSGGGSGDSSIIDLGEQDDHKVAQQAMVDHIMGIEASYCLFKYYCNCSETACFAIVYRLPDDYVQGVVYDSDRRFREFNYSIENEELTLDGCWTPILSINTEFEEFQTDDKSVMGAIDEIYALAVDGYKPSNLNYGHREGESAFTVYGADTSIEEVLIPSRVIGVPVTGISNTAFRDFTNLIKVVIPNSVTSIGVSAFYGCISLTNIVIPNSVTSIAAYAFRDCSSLTSIIIPNSVTSIDAYAFQGCSGLTIYCEAESKPIGWDSTWNYSNCPVVWGFANNFIDVNNKLDEIGSGGSGGSSSIIDLGTQGSHKDAQQAMIDHLTQMNAENGCYLFKYYCDCYGNACFAVVKCWAADDVVCFEGTVYDNYRSFRQFQYNTVDGFYLDGCWLDIASFNESFDGLSTENKTVPEAINELHSMITKKYSEGLSFGQYTNDKTSYFVMDIGNCTDTDIIIPPTYNGKPVTSIYPGAFRGCTNLTSITIPDSVTSIGGGAFRGCENLISVTIPDSVTSILTGAFYGCNKLKSIVIPSSVTSIGAQAFYNCPSLTIYCEADSQPNEWVSDWNLSNRPVVWGAITDILDVKEYVDEKVSSMSGNSGGATLSMPRIRFANYEYLEEVAYSYEQALCTRGRVVFSVNVQDGTLQEGDELQVCSMRSVFDKKKLRPILSRTITAEDIENLAKQPYLRISTGDFSGNSLGKNSMRALTSFRRTDSASENARKPKYIRIRRPVWKENKNGDVVVVNASFSNVVPIQFNLRCAIED